MTDPTPNSERFQSDIARARALYNAQLAAVAEYKRFTREMAEHLRDDPAEELGAEWQWMLRAEDRISAQIVHDIQSHPVCIEPTDEGDRP
jgi:prophage DNA circulation protein